MKTTLLFSAMMLIGLTSAKATTTDVAPRGEDFLNTTRYRFAEPIMFMERGVEFLIFPDGSFDFNTYPGNAFNSYDPYYRESNNSKRSSINNTQGAPGSVSRMNYSARDSGLLIQHDFDGKVRRIGNVFINYDRIGKVKRVGTVYMNYNRGGLLTQVGGLRLTYNSWGDIVHSSGIVNHGNSNYNYNLGHAYVSNNGYTNNYDTDEDYYYYRQGDKVKKQKKIKK